MSIMSLDLNGSLLLGELQFVFLPAMYLNGLNNFADRT
jgi:hypothetical protein